MIPLDRSCRSTDRRLSLNSRSHTSVAPLLVLLCVAVAMAGCSLGQPAAPAQFTTKPINPLVSPSATVPVNTPTLTATSTPRIIPSPTITPTLVFPLLQGTDVPSSLRQIGANTGALELLRLIPQKPDRYVSDLAVSPDNSILAIAYDNFTVRLIAIRDGTDIRTIEGRGAKNGEARRAVGVAFSRDGQVLATNDFDVSTRTSYVEIWSPSSGELIRDIPLVGSAFAFSPDGSFLVAGRYVLKTSDWSLWYDLGGPTFYWSVAISPDSQTIALPGDFPNVRLFHARNGMKFRTLELAFPPVTVDFSPDGTLLATGSLSGAELWKLPGGDLLRKFSVKPRCVLGPAFSASGDLAVIGSCDNIARLWRLADGEIIGLYPGSYIFPVFSNDGRLLVTTDAREVRIWGTP